MDGWMEVGRIKKIKSKFQQVGLFKLKAADIMRATGQVDLLMSSLVILVLKGRPTARPSPPWPRG